MEKKLAGRKCGASGKSVRYNITVKYDGSRLARYIMFSHLFIVINPYLSPKSGIVKAMARRHRNLNDKERNHEQRPGQ